MINVRMTEANARWLLERVNEDCGRLAQQADDVAGRLRWLGRDELRDELLTVLGDLGEKAQAGTMTPTERSERADWAGPSPASPVIPPRDYASGPCMENNDKHARADERQRIRAGSAYHSVTGHWTVPADLLDGPRDCL